MITLKISSGVCMTIGGFGEPSHIGFGKMIKDGMAFRRIPSFFLVFETSFLKILNVLKHAKQYDIVRIN
jgi:hypothetical protein